MRGHRITPTFFDDVPCWALRSTRGEIVGKNLTASQAMSAATVLNAVARRKGTPTVEVVEHHTNSGN